MPARADTSIEVLSSENSYSFSTSLTFTLAVETSSPLSEVILFFGRVKAPLVRRVYPDLETGSQVTLRYTEDVERGQFAPGTVFQVWWELHNEAGDVLITEPTTFEYTDDNQDWQLLAGERVDLYWYGNDRQEAQAFLDAAEADLTRLETDIGVAVTQRVRVYVYNSESDMERAIAGRSDEYDAATITLGMTVDDDAMLLLGADDDAEATLAHELCHIVVGSATENPYSGLPRWLDEGLAMYAQGSMDSVNRRALESGIKSDALLSIRSMSSYSGQASEVNLFYGEAYSIVDFMLQEYGRTKMQELLSVFAEGIDQETALEQVLNVGLDELDTIWRASLGLAPRSTRTPTAVVSAAEQATATPVPTQQATTTTSSERKGICGSLGLLLLPLCGLVWVQARRGGAAH